MVDIALDPNMYYCSMSTADTLRKAADLASDTWSCLRMRSFTFGIGIPKLMTPLLPRCARQSEKRGLPYGH